MGGLRNPIWSDSVKEKYIYLNKPNEVDRRRIKELEGKLAEAESARVAPTEPEMVEVVREVVREDASLIAKLNEAQREVARLRGDLDSRPTLRQPQPVQVREVEKEVVREVVRIQRVVSKRAIALAAAASLLLGFAGGYSIPREEKKEVSAEIKPSAPVKRR